MRHSRVLPTLATASLVVGAVAGCTGAEQGPEFGPTPPILDPLYLPKCDDDIISNTLNRSKGGEYPSDMDPFVVVDDAVRALGSAAVAVQSNTQPKFTADAFVYSIDVPDEGRQVTVTERGGRLATIHLLGSNSKGGADVPDCEVLGVELELDASRGIESMTFNGPSEAVYVTDATGLLIHRDSGAPVTLDEAGHTALVANTIVGEVIDAVGYDEFYDIPIAEDDSLQA